MQKLTEKLYEISENIDDVQECLTALSQDVQILRTNGESPLHLAVKMGNIAIVKLLINEVGDVNILDVDSAIPLHRAVEKSESRDLSTQKTL